MMSIKQYADEFLSAKTPWARCSLFVRSLPLRHKLWSTKRAMEKRDAMRRKQRLSQNGNE